MSASNVTRGVVRWVTKSIVFAVLVGAILFLTSGDWDWQMAWVYLGAYAVQQVALAFILPAELLAERSAQQEGTVKWDRVLSVFAALLLPLAIYAVAGLDHRYGWTAGLPPAVPWIAFLVMALGMVLTGWAMAANRFFSGTVRIQEDRRQTVATGGPYRVVRHPGYVGGVLHHLAAPLVLGSLWALIPGVLGAAALVLRTALEDRTLHEGLSGYAAYAEQTRYRLLPGIW